LIAAEFGNGHYFYKLGSSVDFVAANGALTGGTLLAGGSTDVDNGMKWLLEKAAGGDVVVLRIAANTTGDYQGVDGYNPYIYSELGVKVNSVETILLNSKTVANNAFVAEKVRKAEALFFTGGNQAFYFDYIEGSLLQEAIAYLVNEKKAALGGTSAGCAIQGEFGFTAQFDTITSANALSNPYDQRVNLQRNLIKNKWLQNVITDQHYNNPDRRGRHLTFMARIYKDYLRFSNELVRGIGIDERTAVAVDHDGKAYVFGSNNAYFLEQNGANNFPEICEASRSLEWYRTLRAVNVYRVAATLDGRRYFDLSDWSTGLGGTWIYHYSRNGKFGTA
jgi:cyanophycinase